MTTFKTVIEIAANTAAAEKGLGNVAAQVDRLTGSLRRIGQYTVGAFGAAEALQAARDLGKLSDQYRNLEGRVKLAAGSQSQFTEAQRALFAIAQNNAQALNGVSQLYSRIAKGAGEMGVSQQQVLSIIDSVAKSFRISGASAEEASGATLQFSQALASGVLRGDEFNSIMEQSPRLAQAIADGLDVPIGKLRAMAEAGELTTQKVVGALQKAKASIDADAAGLPDTIEQAMVRWDNAALKFVGTSPEITRAAETIAAAINTAAGNIDTIANGVEIAGSLLVAVLAGKGTAAVAAFAGSQARLVQANLAAATAARNHALNEEYNARAMLASAEAAVANASGMARLAAVETALVPASQRLAVAQAEVAASAGPLKIALGGLASFLGGPTGIAVLLLTAVSAWHLFGSAAESELERVIRKRRELAKETGKDTRGKSETDLSLLQDEAAVKKQEAVVARLAARYKEVGQAADQAFMGGKLGRELVGETALLREMQAELVKRKQAATDSGDALKAKEKQVQQSLNDTKYALKDATTQAETYYKRRVDAIDAIEQTGITRIIQTPPTQPVPGESSTLGSTAQPNNKAKTELEQAQAVFRLQQQAEQARLTAARDYANQRLALVDQVYGREIAKYKDGEDKKTALERESLQARRAIYTELEAAYTASIDKLVAQERRLRDEAVAAAKARQDIELETAQAVKSMAQGAASTEEAARAQYLELQRLIAEQQSALAAGNLDLSKQAGNQAKGIAEALGQQIASALRDVKQKIAEQGKTADAANPPIDHQGNWWDQEFGAAAKDQSGQFIRNAPAQPEPLKPDLGTQQDLQKLIQLRQEIGQLLADAETKTGQTATHQAEQTAQQIQTAMQSAQSVGAEIDKIDQQLRHGFNLDIKADPAALQALQTQLAELLRPETKIINIKVVKDGNSITATPDGSALPDTGLTVPGYRRGGWIKGYGGGDRIPALLEEGEFVLRKEAVRKLGLDKLYALNNLALPRFSIGGYVAQALPAFDASLTRSSDGGQPVHIHLPGIPGSFPLNGDPQVVAALKREVARAALKHGRIVR
ncbi:tape measure protein [Methylococcus mesophilus]|uniref:tape measure protein n=1 Tax=Methylococcus mesophilus TaxID=2993564 RepID=UPI00224B5317|nr:tape measure protein [Methylococcus mesophilus]UZR30793.1 tape measure protein [Methylococcus mesophilus]